MVYTAHYPRPVWEYEVRRTGTQEVLWSWPADSIKNWHRYYNPGIGSDRDSDCPPGYACLIVLDGPGLTCQKER